MPNKGPYPVKTVSSLCYLEDDIEIEPVTKHKKHHLDLYIPTLQNESQKMPMIVFVHGGGWKRGDRKQFYGGYENVGKVYASHGYLTVVISYRLTGFPLHLKIIFSLLMTFILLALELPFLPLYMNGSSLVIGLVLFIFALLLLFPWAILFKLEQPNFKYFDQLYDVGRAIKWVHKHGPEYGGDPNSLILMGHSAGGHLVSLLSLDNRYFERLKFDASKSIKAIVSLSGVYNLGRMNKSLLYRHWYLVGAFGLDRKTLQDASPLTHCKLIPQSYFLLNAQFDFHLTRDTKEFEKLLKQHGVQVETAIVPFADHGSIVRNIGFWKDRTTDFIIPFLEKIVPPPRKTY